MIVSTTEVQVKKQLECMRAEGVLEPSVDDE